MKSKIAQRVFSFLSGKGGVGKSTLCAASAIALSKKGHSVLVIDADIGWRNLDVILEMENDIICDLGAILQSKIPWRECLVPFKDHPQSALIAGTLHTCDYPLSLEIVSRLIREAQHVFEFIFLDLGSGFDQWHQSLCTQSTDLVLISNDDPCSLRSIDQLLGLLGERKNIWWLFNECDHAKKAIQIAKNEMNFPLTACIRSYAIEGIWKFFHQTRLVKKSTLLHHCALELERSGCLERWTSQERGPCFLEKSN